MKKQIFTVIELSELETLFTQWINACLSNYPQLKSAAVDLSESKYITRKEAAKKLRIGLTKLNELKKSGVIPSYLIGCNVRFKEHEVMECLTKLNTGKGVNHV